jgi:predicted O-methyltransferase YrrM
MSSEKMILFIMIINIVLLIALIFRLRKYEYILLETHKASEQQIKRTTKQQIQQENIGLFQQFEALLFLRDRLGMKDGMHFTRHWSASPDFLKLIVEHCLQQKPQAIVECGSGVSTLMLAACCRINGGGNVVSLENDLNCAKASQAELERYQLQDYARIIHAPLERHCIDNKNYQWYSTQNLPQQSYDMLIIDGPPGKIQSDSRYPALPVLQHHLRKGSWIFLDDAARPGERSAVAMWQATWPSLVHKYIHLERGCSQLQWPL